MKKWKDKKTKNDRSLQALRLGALELLSFPPTKISSSFKQEN